MAMALALALALASPIMTYLPACLGRPPARPWPASRQTQQAATAALTALACLQPANRYAWPPQGPTGPPQGLACPPGGPQLAAIAMAMADLQADPIVPSWPWPALALAA